MDFCYPALPAVVFSDPSGSALSNLKNDLFAPLFSSLATIFPAGLSLYIIFVIMFRNKTKYFIEVIIHILFWLVIYYAVKALTNSSFNMLVYNGGATQAINARMLFLYPEMVLGSLIVLFYPCIFWLFPKVIRFKSNFWGMALITGWLLLLFSVNYLLVRLRLGPPANGSHQSNAVLRRYPVPSRIEFFANNWWEMQGVMVLIFLSVLGFAAAYFFIKEWIRNELKRSQAEAHQLSTEIRFLRSQVNPHFLFNTLNNLFSMAQKKGNDELADGISKLSGLMRYMIYDSNTDNAPLQKEIEYLEDNIALNKLRYADSEVSVSFQYPAQRGITQVQLAPMLFIPFLENAFKHGVSIGDHSRITMVLAITQKKLTFTCENTDHSAVKRLDEERGGFGLENVRRRLELVYPGRHTLQAGGEEGKYRVTLQIDLP